MKHDYDVIVLGLGGIGSATLYWLARRGANVLGLEQFAVGHERGGSQDHSRIIRLSYHTPGYVRLAQHAYEAWAEVEADAGEKLIVITGGLDLTHPDTALPIAPYAASMVAAGVSFERLDAAEIVYRWPQWRLPANASALYQPQSGIAPAARCNATHLRLAQQHGATVRDEAPVSAIVPHADHLRVDAGGTTYHCRRLVLTAGAWTNRLLAHFNVHLPLTVTQEQVVYYDTPHAADYTPDRFPVWIWMDEPCFYGFPVYGEAGPKASQDVGGAVVDADNRSFTPNAALQQRIDRFVHAHLPTAFGPPLRIKTCLYTMPPDRDFVLGTLPAHPHVSVAVGAGHAFKFASLLGKILSELSLNGSTPYDITPFRVDRPLLQQENPPTSFLI